MNKNLAGACHLTLWAFLFLSPLTYWRGTGFDIVHYLMTCMNPLFLMIVFYLNYLVLTPKLFVAGKHRYDLLINVVLLIVLGTILHYWMVYVNSIYAPTARQSLDTIGTISYIARDTLNLAIFAAGATALALARRWVTTDQKLRETEAARTQAELSNMRSQINPHFLLNTLNNIYALTAFDAPKAQEAIQELSKMLRHILYDYQQPTVPLKDEVEFLQNYINLMRIRLPNSVEVDAKFNVGNSHLQIAPMLFISLVENAFKHGVSPTEPSFINISVSADEEQIVCDIQNSNHPKTAGDNSGHGIGLQQVQRRLDISYPNNYSWERGVSADGKTYYSKIVLTEINNDNFTYPDFGAEIDNIKGLLKKAITLLNSQEVLLNERLRLEHKLNYEEEKIHQLSQEQKIREKERARIKTMIEKLSESDSEKEKNMVSKLKEQLIDIEQRIDKNIAEIEKSKEKIMSLQENIKSLKEEMHKDRKDKSK